MLSMKSIYPFLAGVLAVFAAVSAFSPELAPAAVLTALSALLLAAR